MASGMNPFDLLDGGAEDVTALVASQLEKAERKNKAAETAAQTEKKQGNSALKTQPSNLEDVRRFEGGAGGGSSRGGRGYGRGPGGGGDNKSPISNAGSFNNGRGAGGAFEGDSAKQHERRGYDGPFRGGHHRGFSNGDCTDRAERLSQKMSDGNGHRNSRNQNKADGCAQFTEEASPETEKLGAQNTVTEDAVTVNNLVEEKPEHKEMTLEEYQKVLEEKKKALHALKVEERKVDTKEFQSMQLLLNKKSNDGVVSKSGSNKDKKKEMADKEEKAKKSISINEFLRPAGGGAYRGRGRGRGRGSGERFNRPEVEGHLRNNNAATPHTEDQDQFPTLAK